MVLTGSSGRWAMVFDNGKVVYAENESNPGQVTVRFSPLQ